jgi:cytochrome oxidase Cu insertion factor (SCO1/SenC/PrrC family)
MPPKVYLSICHETSNFHRPMSRSLVRWLLFAGACAVIAALVVAIMNATFAAKRGPLSGPADAIVSNQDIYPGSPAGDAPAPDFKLVDQEDRPTSLSQFRGKVVVLSFVDSHCTTICPLMTESMVKAMDLLGPNASQVQLLGINANPLATRVADVAAYTRAHQMEGRWRFLTGSLAQLKSVWRDYHVYVAAIHNDIDHQPIIFLIGPQGRERTIYFTQMSYGGVAQQAQVLAEGIARLLPNHPMVHQEVSLRQIPALKPAETVQLPALGPRDQTVVLGRTHPHLLLFFASWLDEESNLPARLAVLDGYAATARRQNWPSPVAIDELSTEPSAATAQTTLLRLATTLHVPVVEDTQGRLADGYGVQDLPWFVLTSQSGQILWHHDGWLSSDALSQQVRAALAGK